MDLSDRVLIEQITTHPIDGVGRIPNHPSSLEDLHDVPDQPGLGIFRIDGEDHDLPSVSNLSRPSKMKKD
jgi:hypothetical protein